MNCYWGTSQQVTWFVRLDELHWLLIWLLVRLASRFMLVYLGVKFLCTLATRDDAGLSD